MTPSDPRRWRVLPVILTATFMALFDFFVVNVAAPSLQKDLNASDATLELIVGGYAFCYASGLVTGGRLGDLLGYRRMFIIGMSGFTLASVLCGVAQSPGELVAARMLQGLTAAAMVPQVLALVTSMFPPEERPRAVSWFGVAIGTGGVAGQILGGLLLDLNLFGWGWRPIFLVNLPVGIVAVTLAARLLPGHKGTLPPKLDPIGAVGLSASLALALVPLVLGRTLGWPLWTWISMAAALPALALVLLWQRALARRGGQPLIDLSLFGNRVFSAGLVINFTYMAFFASLLLGATLFLQAGLHLSPLESGLTFGPMAIVNAIASVSATRFIARWGGPAVIAAGSLINVVALGILFAEMALDGSELGAPALIPPLFIMGLGSGLAFPSLVGAVVSGVQVRQAGGAAGVLTTTQQFASAAGVAVIGTAFFSTLGTHPQRSDFVHALEVVTAACLVLIALASALTVLLRPRTGINDARNSVEVPEPVS